MKTPSPPNITLSQFAKVYILFSVLVILAMFIAELRPSLDLYRTIYTIWATTVLLTPALVCYVFIGYSNRVNNYWRLFWTFSYLAFLVHFYWAVFIVFDGVVDSFVKQGPAIAIPNYILTVWWGFDVLMLWLVKKPDDWVRLQRFGVHVFVFLVFAVTTLYLKDGTVRLIGAAMTAIVVLSIVVRLLASSRFEQAAADDVAAYWF